jgi:hypothetical protein
MYESRGHLVEGDTGVVERLNHSILGRQRNVELIYIFRTAT